MDALTENPLANMPGPDFLVFYGLLAVAAVLAVVFASGALGDGATARATLPGRPDPYALAFLRDGYGGVAWLAIYALKRAGLIELDAKNQLQRLAGEAAPGDVCETAVLRAIGPGCSAASIAAKTAAQGVVGAAFAPRLHALEAQRLVRNPNTRGRVKRLAIWLGAALMLLAAYKFAVAEAHGHRNVQFLIVEAFVTALALTVVAVRLGAPKPTPEGRALLERAKLAYAVAPKPQAEPQAFGVDPLIMLTVASVGFAALAAGPDAAFAQQARRTGADSNGGGCSSGGSCSSGGDGGGGGCGGCGGGD